MTIDPLSSRFPEGRRVVLGTRPGTVSASSIFAVCIAFDDCGMDRYDVDWFRRYPRTLRLVSWLNEARVTV